MSDQGTTNAWLSTIPFPIQVVSRLTIHDANSGVAYITEYHYRNGYYDGEKKEFRGFAEIIETQVGDESAPTTVIHHVYDVGDTVESRKGLLKSQNILKEGAGCRTPTTGCYRQITNTLATYEVVPGRSSFSTVTRTQTLVYEATEQPVQLLPVQLLQTFAYDQYGNQTENFNFGIVCPSQNGTFDVACGNDELLTHTEYAVNPERWIVNKLSVITQTDNAGNVVSLIHLHYDGDDHEGLPLGTVERGNLTRQEQSLGPLGNNRFIQTKRQAFDAYGNVICIKDGNGNLTTVEYDELVHTFPVLESIHLDNSRALTYTADYDFGFGKIISATEFNGNTTLFTYDTFGRIASIVRPGDTLTLPTQQFDYVFGSPRSSITTHQREQSGTANVRTSVVYFDGLGRKLQTRSEAEHGQWVVADAVTFNARQSVRDQFLPYFADGFAYQSPNPTLPHSSKEYDPLSRVVRTVNPDDSFTSVAFQPLLQIHSDEEDNRPGSPHVGTPKTLHYDGLERLIEVVETNRVSDTVESYHTAYRYDPLGNLSQITDAQDNIKIMQYDALSRKVFIDDPDRGEMRYVYDDAGNLRQTTDAKGQVITYTYDAANRPVTELWPTGDGGAEMVFTYHYDDMLSPLHPDARNTLGQVTYIEDPEGAVYFSYDDRGNVAGRIRSFTKEDFSFVTRIRYDAMDRLSELTYPDGFTVTYHYNSQGLLEAIPGFVANADYTPSGQREAITYTNGVATHYDYDDRLRLKHLYTAAGENVLQDLGYDFDWASNITSITDGRPGRTDANDQTQSFGYDSLYRLTKAIGKYGQINYVYDSIGNMVHQSSTTRDDRLNLGEMHYGGDNAGPHALTFANGVHYRYDANGNRVSKGKADYTWNPRDWLVTVGDGVITSTHAYDSTGQRIRQTVNKNDGIATTLYLGQFAEVRQKQFIYHVFDGQQRIAQVTIAIELTSFHRGFSDGKTIDSNTTSGITSSTLWYLADHLGGTNLLVGEQGQAVSEVAYYPYGSTRHELNGGKAHHKFTGKELDVSGLYYFGARYFDPLTGRFVNPDPLYAETPEKWLETPQGLNLYVYTFNNPLHFVDPQGTDPVAVEERYETGRTPETVSQDKALPSSWWDVAKYVGGTLEWIPKPFEVASIADLAAGHVEFLAQSTGHENVAEVADWIGKAITVLEVGLTGKMGPIDVAEMYLESWDRYLDASSKLHSALQDPNAMHGFGEGADYSRYPIEQVKGWCGGGSAGACYNFVARGGMVSELSPQPLKR